MLRVSKSIGRATVAKLGFDKLVELGCAFCGYLNASCRAGNGKARRNTATLSKSFATLRRTLPLEIALDSF
jgi:hypothetical protein